MAATPKIHKQHILRNLHASNMVTPNIGGQPLNLRHNGLAIQQQLIRY